MVQKFRMPKYVNIWRSNEKGNKDELLMETQMGGLRLPHRAGLVSHRVQRGAIDTVR